LIIIIGTKMKVFRVQFITSLDIPRAIHTKVNQEDLRRAKYVFDNHNSMELWEMAGIDIQMLRDKIEWQLVEEMKDCGSPVLDVLETEHHFRIFKAMQNIGQIAAEKGTANRFSSIW
jgi:hypothetical protein